MSNRYGKVPVKRVKDRYNKGSRMIVINSSEALVFIDIRLTDWHYLLATAFIILGIVDLPSVFLLLLSISCSFIYPSLRLCVIFISMVLAMIKTEGIPTFFVRIRHLK